MNASTAVEWDFFSNAFINDYVQHFPDEIKILDNRSVMPEIPSGVVSTAEAYIKYYFLENFHLADVESKLLLLHNSWTPPFFKRLPPNDLFRLDCTLVNILAEALGIKLPDKRNRVRLVTRENAEPNNA